MSDIVERLRKRRMWASTELAPGVGRSNARPVWITDEPDPDCAEAADEIARLRADFELECRDTDAILRALGLDPANCRTDGGSLKLQMLLGAIEHRDVMLKRGAKLAERERGALLCEAAPERYDVTGGVAEICRALAVEIRATAATGSTPPAAR